jgi:hypothetical protein
MLAILVFLAAAAAPAAETEPAPSVTVHLADGSQLPLFNWVLSYEFLSAKPGAMPSNSRRRDTQELRLGGKTTPLRGAQLELHYELVERERADDEGEIVKEKRQRVVALTLTREGKKTKLKPQSPERSFLVGDEKALNVLPRSLDLFGQTVTGTRRELCLFSFSDLAECGSGDDGRVVRLEFQ